MAPEQLQTLQQAAIMTPEQMRIVRQAIDTLGQEVSNLVTNFANTISQVIDDNPEFFAALLEPRLGPDGKPLGEE